MDWRTLLDTWLVDVGAKAGRNLLADLSDKPLKVATGAMKDIAQLRTREVAGEIPAAYVAKELKLCESTLKDLEVGVSIEFARTFVQVLRDSAAMAGSMLLPVIKQAAKALGL